MDLGAISMAKEFKLPIKIFKLGDDFYDILSGMGKYTLISEE
jgi:uridylate kinase